MMTYKHDGYNWLVRIEKGEELIGKLTELIEKENIPTCWISGLGATSKATLGFYDLQAGEYNWKEFDELMEITGLQGNIAWQEGKVKLHIHGSFSRHDMGGVGGHVKALVAGGTVEVFLHKWYDGQVTRKRDEETGLDLLNL